MFGKVRDSNSKTVDIFNIRIPEDSELITVGLQSSGSFVFSRWFKPLSELAVLFF